MAKGNRTARSICREHPALYSKDPVELEIYVRTSCYLTSDVFERLLHREFDCQVNGSVLDNRDLFELIKNPGKELLMLNVRCFASKWNDPRAKLPVHEFIIFPHEKRLVQSYYRHYGRHMTLINRRVRRDLLHMPLSIEAYSRFVKVDIENLIPDWFPLKLYVVRFVTASSA